MHVELVFEEAEKRKEIETLLVQLQGAIRSENTADVDSAIDVQETLMSPQMQQAFIMTKKCVLVALARHTATRAVDNTVPACACACKIYIKGSKKSQIISKNFPQQQISSHEESKAVSEVNRMSRQ